MGDIVDALDTAKQGLADAWRWATGPSLAKAPPAPATNIQDNGTSLSVSFEKPQGGITSMSFSPTVVPGTYITSVKASGQNDDTAQLAAIALKLDQNLQEQRLFAGEHSFTFAYNQAKPSYIISELERSKLISPTEAQAARDAFAGFQSRLEAKPKSQAPAP
jgi:hypothetical protein